MEEKDINSVHKRKTHPKAGASFLSQLFFCWELPILIKGYRKELIEDHLYEPLPEHDSKNLADRLEQNWQEEVNCQKEPSLWRVLIKTFGYEFMCYCIWYPPLEVFASIIQPFSLKRLLDYYMPHQTEVTKQEAYLYASLIVVSALLRVIMFNYQRLQLTALGIKMRIACSSLIYRKSLKLKKSTFQKVTVAHIVNLLSSDVHKFDLTILFLQTLWLGPLDLIMIACYLWLELGPITVTGLIFSFAFLIFLSCYSKKIILGRKEAAIKADYRVRLANDIVSGIKVIKMYTWEQPFTELIASARALELGCIRKLNFLRFLSYTWKIFVGKFFFLASITAAVLTDTALTTQYVFVLLTCCEALKSMLVIFTVKASMFVRDLQVSVQRIKSFLLVDESKFQNISAFKPRNFQKTFGISIHNANVKWNSFSKVDILKHINFDAIPRELVGVIGCVGSGKSTLIQTILNETVVTGKLKIEGVLSYASQEPWIFSSSVRQNILFGEKMDKSRYLEVIRICALEEDFSRFPHGDRSLVGEKGIKLSGGQKSRIGLARAVYKNADIYLLDDPLSAVDTQVGNRIFSECVVSFLKDKCVVLVTNQLKYIEDCNRIYMINEGKVTLLEKNKDLSNFVSKIHTNKNENINEMQTTLPLEEKEHRSSGMPFKVYRSYCKAGGNYFVTIMYVFMAIIIQFVSSFYEYFLIIWTNLEQNLLTMDPKFGSIFTTMNCLYFSIALVLLIIFLSTLASWSLAGYTKKASKKLHDKLLKGVLHTSMTFFSNHSSGRILNRFSGDIALIDEIIPGMIIDLLIVFLSVNGTFILISVANYWMLLPMLAVYLILFAFWKGFNPTNRCIKRIERITKSPILTHLLSSLEGLSTIRAFNCEKILEKEFDNYQNLHTSVSYLSVSLYLTLCFWTELICHIYIALAVFGFFLIKTNLGYVALGITQSICVTGYIQNIMRTWSELNTLMASVERVEEYSSLPPEKNDGTNIPQEAWPNSGALTFQSVSMKYSEGAPHVLKQVSFHVNPREKIGIVGRTGAGKSSLISALTRLFNFEGRIVIDGIDTKTISLQKLRSHVSIIPQEPVLFLGTLRKNLDIFDEFTDEELWNTLEEIELKKAVTSLDSAVSEGGSNFSVGQRQLICLGRVMLKKTKIIVLDEATANVDAETDKLIQKTIRQKFGVCTILTIAHRINTVMDSDKVLVLEAGEIVEFDHPSTLLQNKNGHFYSYVNSKKQ